jgi:hypothetical protein
MTKTPIRDHPLAEDAVLPPRLLAAEDWAATATLLPVEVDCVTAVMLKILDGKCKMAADEKGIMERLYDACTGRDGLLLGNDYHDLVQAARADRGEPMRARVYEQGVLAETMISRPVMKGFKARLRREGVLPAMEE